MAGQYTPHRVDVPVLDLDDPDDDAFLNTRPAPGSYRFMDLLDYANAHENVSWTTRMARKLRRYLRPGHANGSYELAAGDSDSEFFDIDDDDAATGESLGPDLRKYEIKRLERKLNKTIMCFACGLVFVFAFLFFKKDSFAPSESPSQKILLSNSTHQFHPTTILISLDGFHPHYISEDITPALHRMLVERHGAPYMEPSFPSSTFPNHWTLVTGLYPADHGIVGNTFYDPVLQKQFINTNPDYGLDPDFWRGGEPIWTTAANQGVRSAIHMWPGSEVPGVGDRGPSFVDKYNGSEPLAAKAARIFSWIDSESLDERPELVLAYVPTIDQVGHKHGISGAELNTALRQVDGFVQLVLDNLAQRNLEDIVNVVIVSDHGMAPTSNDRLLFLDDIVDLDAIEHIDGWPLFGLRPRPNHSIDEIYSQIRKKLDAKGPELASNFSLYRVEDFPPEWQFGGALAAHTFNYRLAPLWIVPSVGFSVTTRAKFEENNNEYYPKGVHGYNNTQLLMRAIFLGQGPYFDEKLAKNKKVLPFSNVNLYNILCDTLQIVPSPNNGTLGGDNFVISTSNNLPSEWSDNLVYPDLPYEVEHIVRNATYDKLWRPSSAPSSAGKIAEDPNSSPLSSSPSPAQSFSSGTSTIPSAKTTEGAETDSKHGFFGNLIDSVGDVIVDIENGLEDAVDGAIDYADSFFGGDD